jgi:hypothetical protein
MSGRGDLDDATLSETVVGRNRRGPRFDLEPRPRGFFVLRRRSRASGAGMAPEDEETGPWAHFLFLGPALVGRGRCSAQTTS